MSLIGPLPGVYAQNYMNLPTPGSMVGFSSVFKPAIMKGLRVYPDNPLRFDFIIDTGNTDLTNFELEEESTRLIRYFLATLTVPDDDLWVNLSPYEGDRIIPEKFSATDMGRDLLAQDYLLKQITASVIYPEDQLGRKFWATIHKKAQQLYGSADVPVNTFNKVWVVPEKAVVYVHNNVAFISESRLKVMLESDYLALKENKNNEDLGTNTMLDEDIEDVNDVSSAIVRELVIPEIEKEVNEGEHFTALRQIYNSVILATWFHRNLKQNVLSKIYVGQNKIDGIDIEDKEVKEKIYQQYLEAFRLGVYNYVKEDYDPTTQQIIPRKYFSGGMPMAKSDVPLDERQGMAPNQVADGGFQVVRGGVDGVGENGEQLGLLVDGEAQATQENELDALMRTANRGESDEELARNMRKLRGHTADRSGLQNLERLLESGLVTIEEKTIRVSSLIQRQEYLSEFKVGIENEKSQIREDLGLTDQSPPIMVYRFGKGRMFVQEGHTRSYVAHMRNQGTIRAIIVDFGDAKEMFSSPLIQQLFEQHIEAIGLDRSLKPVRDMQERQGEQDRADAQFVLTSLRWTDNESIKTELFNAISTNMDEKELEGLIEGIESLLSEFELPLGYNIDSLAEALALAQSALGPQVEEATPPLQAGMGGLIGPYELVTEPVLEERADGQTVITFIGQNINTGMPESIELPVRRQVTSEEMVGRLDQSNTEPILRTMRNWFEQNLDVAYIIEDNDYDIHGLAANDFIAVAERFENNEIAIYHEIGEAMGSRTATSAERLLDLVEDKSWYEHKMKDKKRQGMELHYALRALFREVFGQRDIDLTYEIKGRFSIDEVFNYLTQRLPGNIDFDDVISAFQEDRGQLNSRESEGVYLDGIITSIEQRLQRDERRRSARESLLSAVLGEERTERGEIRDLLGKIEQGYSLDVDGRQTMLYSDYLKFREEKRQRQKARIEEEVKGLLAYNPQWVAQELADYLSMNTWLDSELSPLVMRGLGSSAFRQVLMELMNILYDELVSTEEIENVNVLKLFSSLLRSGPKNTDLFNQIVMDVMLFTQEPAVVNNTELNDKIRNNPYFYHLFIEDPSNAGWYRFSAAYKSTVDQVVRDDELRQDLNEIYNKAHQKRIFFGYALQGVLAHYDANTIFSAFLEQIENANSTIDNKIYLFFYLVNNLDELLPQNDIRRLLNAIIKEYRATEDVGVKKELLQYVYNMLPFTDSSEDRKNIVDLSKQELSKLVNDIEKVHSKIETMQQTYAEIVEREGERSDDANDLRDKIDEEIEKEQDLKFLLEAHMAILLELVDNYIDKEYSFTEDILTFLTKLVPKDYRYRYVAAEVVAQFKDLVRDGNPIVVKYLLSVVRQSQDDVTQDPLYSLVKQNILDIDQNVIFELLSREDFDERTGYMLLLRHSKDANFLTNIIYGSLDGRKVQTKFRIYAASWYAAEFLTETNEYGFNEFVEGLAGDAQAILQDFLKDENSIENLFDDVILQDEHAQMIYMAELIFSTHKLKHLKHSSFIDIAKNLVYTKIDNFHDNAYSDFKVGKLTVIKRRNPKVYYAYVNAHELMHNVLNFEYNYNSRTLKRGVIHELFSDLQGAAILEFLGEDFDIVDFERLLASYLDGVQADDYHTIEVHEGARVQLKYIMDVLDKMGVPLKYDRFLRIGLSVIADEYNQFLSLKDTIDMMIEQYVLQGTEVEIIKKSLGDHTVAAVDAAEEYYEDSVQDDDKARIMSDTEIRTRIARALKDSMGPLNARVVEWFQQNEGRIASAQDIADDLEIPLPIAERVITGLWRTQVLDFVPRPKSGQSDGIEGAMNAQLKDVMEEGHRGLFEDMKRMLTRVVDRYYEGSWRQYFDELESRQTPEDAQLIDNALEQMRVAGFPPEMIGSMKDRIILVDEKDRRLDSDKSVLGGLIIRHRGQLKIVFPRDRLRKPTLRFLGHLGHEFTETYLIQLGVPTKIAHNIALRINDALDLFANDDMQAGLELMANIAEGIRQQHRSRLRVFYNEDWEDAIVGSVNRLEFANQPWYLLGQPSTLYHNYEHSISVANRTRSFAIERGLSADQVEFLYQVGLLHDWDPNRDANTPASVRRTLELLKQDWEGTQALDGEGSRSFLREVLGWTEEQYHIASMIIARSQYPFGQGTVGADQQKDPEYSSYLLSLGELWKLDTSDNKDLVRFAMHEAYMFTEYVDKIASHLNPNYGEAVLTIESLADENLKAGIKNTELTDRVKLLGNTHDRFLTKIGDQESSAVDRQIAQLFGLSGIQFPTRDQALGAQDQRLFNRSMVGFKRMRDELNAGKSYDQAIDASLEAVEAFDNDGVESAMSQEFGDTDPADNTEDLGGIDLTSDALDIETRGQDVEFTLPTGLENIESMPIKGFTPVIFEIVPIQTLPMLLGESDGAETTPQLSLVK